MPTNADICIMYVLVVAATAAEIQPCIDFVEQYSTHSSRDTVEVLITGVGLLAASYLLASNINNYRPDVIIQAGIAGTFDENITNGTLFAVSSDMPGDTGVWENGRFRSVFDLGLEIEDSFPFTGSRLVNPYDKLVQLAGCPSVPAITVSEITTNAERITWYRKTLCPVLESMEGAALHYVCLQENIPFLQLRTISNQVGNRNKASWNIPLAIEVLNKKIIQLINELSVYDETHFRIQPMPK